MVRLLGIFRGLGGELFLSDVEPFKYKYRIGLETLIVYTLNQWALHVNYSMICVYVNA